MESSFAELRGDFESLRKEVLATIVQERAKHRYGSLLSLSTVSTYDGDNTETWISFRRELIGKVFRSQTLDRHKDVLIAYMMKLEKSGLLDKVAQASNASPKQQTPWWTKHLFMETIVSLPDLEVSEEANKVAKVTTAQSSEDATKQPGSSSTRTRLSTSWQHRNDLDGRILPYFQQRSNNLSAEVDLNTVEEELINHRQRQTHVRRSDNAQEEYGAFSKPIPARPSISVSATANTSRKSVNLPVRPITSETPVASLGTVIDTPVVTENLATPTEPVHVFNAGYGQSMMDEANIPSSNQAQVSTMTAKRASEGDLDEDRSDQHGQRGNGSKESIRSKQWEGPREGEYGIGKYYFGKLVEGAKTTFLIHPNRQDDFHSDEEGREQRIIKSQQVAKTVLLGGIPEAFRFVEEPVKWGSKGRRLLAAAVTIRGFYAANLTNFAVSHGRSNDRWRMERTRASPNRCSSRNPYEVAMLETKT
jgi:hypothetical protein